MQIAILETREVRNRTTSRFQKSESEQMKPYGVRIEEWPDVADIQNMAAKSACGCLQGKGGDYRGYNRNKAGKWRMRRMWKRIARRLGNREIQSQLEES